MAPFSTKLKPITSVVEVEKDEEIFRKKKRNPRWLSLFRSPVSEEDLNSGIASEVVSRKKPTSAVLTPSHELVHDIDSDDEEEEAEKHEEGAPRLRRHHKTSVVQLFYDLFFVANLTTFTSKHEINSVKTLKTYVAFFVILWATWFQVAKYDVRFAGDSVFERVCKALQFGVMVGFAVTGPKFSTTWEADTPEAGEGLQVYQITTLILMTSRLILCAQYCSVYWFIRKKPKAHIPMVLHILTALGCAMVYLFLFFAFKPSTPGNDGNAIIGWYITLASEAIFLLVVSGRYRFMSFRHTPIVERLSLLTLIILGEGIIGLTGAVSKIGTSESYTPAVIGQLISAVSIVYFLWMLYSDQTEKKRVGRLRQEIWTVLHFPFHIAILLVVEGQITLTVWVKLQEFVNIIFEPFNDPIWNPYNDWLNATDYLPYNATLPPLPPFPSDSAVSAFANSLNATLAGVYSTIDPTGFVTSTDGVYNSTLDNIIHSNKNWTTFYDQVSNITITAVTAVCKNFALEPPEGSVPKGSSDFYENYSAIVNIFYTVFTYFFIAAGSTLILLTVLLTFGRIQHFRSEFFMMVVRYLIGLGLALLALMNLPSLANDYLTSTPAIDTYLSTPWVVPTVCICYAVVILSDNLVAQFLRRRFIKWADQHPDQDEADYFGQEARNSSA